MVLQLIYPVVSILAVTLGQYMGWSWQYPFSGSWRNLLAKKDWKIIVWQPEGNQGRSHLLATEGNYWHEKSMGSSSVEGERGPFGKEMEGPSTQDRKGQEEDWQESKSICLQREAERDGFLK